MKILAVEFSSAQRSVAVAVAPEDGPASVRASAQDSGGRSVKALAMVEAALRDAGLRREEVDCIAVGLGPGSYAGVRAAISLAQGWQLARGVRTIGISSVECLAADAGERGVRGNATFIVDAQRGEYYLAVYAIEDSALRVVEPLHIVPQAQVADRIKRGERLLGPDPISAPADQFTLLYPQAATLAKLAAARREFVAGEQLEPIYLREARFVKAPPPRVLP
jgi:tRNA threonylcarbamoyl adenosine modification protein YeaZ